MPAAEGPAGSSVDCGPPHAATDSAAASAGAAVAAVHGFALGGGLSALGGGVGMVFTD